MESFNTGMDGSSYNSMNISWDDFGLRRTASENNNNISLERSNSITGKKSSYMDRLRQNQQRIQKNRSANEKLISENNELSNNVKEMLRKGFSISKVKKVTSELLETDSPSHETLVDGKSFISSIGSLSDMFVNVSSSDTNENAENIPSMDQLPPTNSFLKIEEPWSFVQEALNLTSRNPSIIDLTGQTSSSQMNPSSRAIGMKRTISKIRQHSVENENESYLNNKSYLLEQKRLRYADLW